MAFTDTSEENKIDPRLQEQDSCALTIEKDYFTKQTYISKYELKLSLPTDRSIVLEGDSFKFGDNTNLLLMRSKTQSKKFSIIFSPQTPGNHQLTLYVAARNRGLKVDLIKRTLTVKSPPSVKGIVKKSLPELMKLGQKTEVIFLFKNEGSYSITEINIDIKHSNF